MITLTTYRVDVELNEEDIIGTIDYNEDVDGATNYLVSMKASPTTFRYDILTRYITKLRGDKTFLSFEITAKERVKRQIFNKVRELL